MAVRKPGGTRLPSLAVVASFGDLMSFSVNMGYEKLVVEVFCLSGPGVMNSVAYNTGAKCSWEEVRWKQSSLTEGGESAWCNS